MSKFHLLLAVLLMLAFILLPTKASEEKAETTPILANGVYQANPSEGIYIVVYNLGETIFTENCANYADGTSCDLVMWTHFTGGLYSKDNEQNWLNIYTENPDNYSFSFTHFQDNGSTAFAAYQWVSTSLPPELASYSHLNLLNLTNP